MSRNKDFSTPLALILTSLSLLAIPRASLPDFLNQLNPVHRLSAFHLLRSLLSRLKERFM